jgi:hypothetical protein
VVNADQRRILVKRTPRRGIPSDDLLAFDIDPGLKDLSVSHRTSWGILPQTPRFLASLGALWSVEFHHWFVVGLFLFGQFGPSYVIGTARSSTSRSLGGSSPDQTGMQGKAHQAMTYRQVRRSKRLIEINCGTVIMLCR